MRSAQLRKVMALLDVENAIIRRGDLTRLSNIADQKELLLQDISQLSGAADDLKVLRQAARENARLLAAAIEGVKEARARLAELDEVRSGLSIYGADGTRQTVTTHVKGLERRA